MPRNLVHALIGISEIVVLGNHRFLLVELNPEFEDELAAAGADDAEAESDDEDSCEAEDSPVSRALGAGDIMDAEPDD